MKRLYDLDPKEVSLVKRGANRKKFLIMKNEDGMDNKTVVDMSAELGQKLEKVLKEMGEDCKLDERGEAAIKAAARILAPHKDKLKDLHFAEMKKAIGMPGMEGEASEEVEESEEEIDKGGPGSGRKPEGGSRKDKEGNSDKLLENEKLYLDQIDSFRDALEIGDQKALREIRSKINDLQAERDKLKSLKKSDKSHLEKMGYRKSPDAEMQMKSEKDKKEGKVSESSVNKSLDLSAFPKEQHAQLEAIFKAHEALVQKNESLEKELNAEKEQRVTKAFTEKASEYKNLGIESGKLATILKSVNEKAPEVLAELETVLKAADAQIGKGKLFAEVGVRHSGAGADAESRLDALVDSVVQKSGSKSRAQVYDEVLQSAEGRRLYAESQSARLKAGA